MKNWETTHYVKVDSPSLRADVQRRDLSPDWECEVKGTFNNESQYFLSKGLKKKEALALADEVMEEMKNRNRRT